MRKFNEENQITPEDITAGKKEAIKDFAETPDLELDNLSDDQLDNLLGQLSKKEESYTEKAKEIVECLEAVEGSEEDIKEALKVHMGFKLEEAQEVLNDVRLSRMN